MTEDEVRISKTLSYWLRHRPDAAGLALDTAGWAEVDTVLDALARSGVDCGWTGLLRVVDGNDKQRFELSADAGRIRARQGHSVPVELGWPETAPPARLFHGTTEAVLAAILAEGLQPMRRHHVHLSGDVETARRIGSRRGPPVVLEIDAERMAEDGHRFLLTGNGVWLTAHVPADRLRAVERPSRA